MGRIIQEKIKKNRYYKGKQLRSEDFLLEQNYHENIRNQLNRETIGVGILNGLEISKVNDKVIELKAGSALNSSGQFIHVFENKMIQLDEIHQFNAIDEEVMELHLSYCEKNEDNLFCALSEDKNHEEANHIQCGYSLYLSVPKEDPFNSYFNQVLLFEDSDIKITQRLPLAIPKNQSYHLIIDVEKKNKEVLCNFQYIIKAQDMMEPQKKITGQVKNIQSRKEIFTYVLQRNRQYGNSTSVFEIEQIKVEKARESVIIPLSYSKSIPVVDDVETYLKKRIALAAMNHQDVSLGTIYLEMKNGAWQIMDIEPAPLNHRILPLYFKQIQENIYKEYGIEEKSDEIESPKTQTVQAVTSGKIYLTEMNLENHLYMSERCFHGLSRGEVMVDVAIISQETINSNKNTTLLMGDLDLLKKQPKVAIQVFVQEGTFKVFLQKEPSDYQTIGILWSAKKIKSENIQNESSALLRLEPSITELSPLESCLFTPVFIDESKIVPCHFSLLNPESGEIESDGFYHAPNESGIYLICCESTNQECAYAYVHVKEKPHD